MSYTALYRKFRPTHFDDVKGQEHIVTTLKNQILADRIGHAYLFTGTRGTGKTTIAKIFARAINCIAPEDGNPCGTCSVCQAIAAGASMNVIEIDAASNNGVDNIREIVDEVSYSPTEGSYKVYIIDEVHMLSIGAFNALLKTLEEPPSYVIFILATTEVHKIPITILSRCQRYDFKRISVEVISNRLRELVDAEQVDIEEKALRYIAKIADGSLRDGISLLDQCIAFHIGSTLTFDMVLDVLGAVDTSVFSELVRALVLQDVITAIQLMDEVVVQGRNLQQFVVDLNWYLRNLLLIKTSGTEQMEEIIEVSTDNLLKLKEEADMMDMDRILRYIRIFSELVNQLRYATGKRVLIEITLIKICNPAMEVDTNSLVDRVRTVENKLEKGIVVQATAADSAKVEKRALVERPPLPQILPEEIKEIIQDFNSLRNTMPGLMKTSMKQAELSIGSKGELVIGIPDGYESDYFNFEENLNALKEFFEDEVGKSVEFTIIKIEKREDFERQYPDTSSLICMDLIEE